MLYDDGRIGDQRPKIVRSKARVALKMVEEGLWISVIVVIYVQTSVSAMISLAGRTPFLHVGCLTQSNFFHSFGCRLFLLALLRFRSCSSRAATGIAGGGRREATAGRRAAAAAEAAAEP
jgi:hypothetical protein